MSIDKDTSYIMWTRKKGETRWIKVLRHSSEERIMSQAIGNPAQEVCVEKVVREKIYRRP